MTTPGESALRLPQPSIACLKPLDAPEVLAAFVAVQPKSRCALATAENILSGVVPFAQTVAEALTLGLLQQDADLLLAKTQNAAQPVSSTPAQDALRAIAVRALGGPSSASSKQRRDLAALALRQLYGLEETAPWPNAQRARCALLARIVASFGGAFESCARQPLKTFKFDEMSRRIYLAFAGVERGTVLQADAALLSKGLGGPADTVHALTVTIIQAAIRAWPADSAETAGTCGLEGFASSVRQLAGRMETKPYAGRVAIAQVYDAGLAEGLDLGSLEEFKANLAGAAKEGLLDLERYDINGPLDAGLKERSRLRLGRDERHFIVNQWI
jgi:hypothetical protein